MALELTVEPYMEDAEGRMVPRERIRPDLILQDEMVRKIAAQAEEMAQLLSAMRRSWFDDVDAFLQLLTQHYQARKTARGNTTFTSFDGRLKVEVAVGDFIRFGPQLQVAKALVDECLQEWSNGANANLQAIVDNAFDVGKEGKVRTDQILALRRLSIDDAKWARAMEAISESIQVERSQRYIRIHTRADATAPWLQVKLNLASAS